MVQQVIAASAWLDIPTNFQILANSSFITNVSIKAIANTGTTISSREEIFFCGILSISAIVSLALRNAVSPEVTGQATTPITAITAPVLPSHDLQISLTSQAGSGLMAGLSARGCVNA